MASHKQSQDEQDPVVASLRYRSPHPYSSIAISPNRHHAVAAGKDTLTVLSVGPFGLSHVQSFRVSQHFQTTVESSSTNNNASLSKSAQGNTNNTYGDIRDTFGLPKPRPTPTASGEATVNCTHIAWSLPQTEHNNIHESFHDNETPSSIHASNRDGPTTKSATDTLVAVAGSNGMVVVWNARQFFSSAGNQNPIPEAVLTQHSRAVNKLAWHSTGRRPELLLSASQDSTVKLWERRANGADGPLVDGGAGPGLRSWFGMHSSFLHTTKVSDRSISWHCKFTFQPRSEAVRDIVWSPFDDNVFAMVTGSGCLIVYNITAPARPWVKIAAHSGEATTLDWHPTHPFIVATGGGSQDQRVKIWDLESSMDLSKKDDKNIARNAGSAKSDFSASSAASESSNNDETVIRSGTSTPRGHALHEAPDLNPMAHVSYGSAATRSLSSSNVSLNSTLTSNKFVATATRHVLSISASVTRIKWRPPSINRRDDNIGTGGSEVVPPDRHDAMLAVATAPIKGAHAGGFGVLGLWSHHRPFMPLSVLEGHRDGAVADFIWLDTPNDADTSPPPPPLETSPKKDVRRRNRLSTSEHGPRDLSRSRDHHSPNVSAVFPFEAEAKEDKRQVSEVGVWQHVLSVGRDGRCLLQSFARGDRPISRVPPSCFAMANLSPFQSGYGSLQICSVHQRVPSSPKDDFLLTGLRRDSTTAQAPGVFREPALQDNGNENQRLDKSLIEGVRHPGTTPKLVVNVLDDGKLDDHGAPISLNQPPFMVAPEVVHLSRFADSYKFYVDASCRTRVDLCFHNGDVADRLRCGPLARMWRMLASILQGSGLSELPTRGSGAGNAMEYVLLPTLRSLLEQRADAGDVQTCVALCEVMQVMERPSGSQRDADTKPGDANDGPQNTRIPGLELNLVREWYLSYIDLLQQMCLFSHATNLIRNCNDPFIGALNQQSTTIHESCPHCRKPLQGGEGIQSNTRRTCKSCRRRVGLCFLCHEPVKGVFVWCPGCGHGGHLDHALQWFGGMSGKPVRELCPTGCGHKCNLVQQLSAFPKTASLLRVAPNTGTCTNIDESLTIA